MVFRLIKMFVLGSAVIVGSLPLFAQDNVDTAIEAALNNPFRKSGDAARDSMRHPDEFFRFLGLKPTMTVAEINPGGGWYSRILAPFLRDRGLYVGLEHHPEEYANFTRFSASLRAYPDKVDQDRDMYGDRAIATWIPARGGLPVPAESVDAVIAVRALHNWVRADFFDAAADQVWQILKPGGVFGVVQHRADENAEGAAVITTRSGRWKQSELIKVIEAYGFRLVAVSEMNANPKDTMDYIHGVWTLPPRFALGDEDREKYAAIGESDRMTLKFEKIAR